jgi:CubicO group peptidase (beta-lactamase class C family)
VSADAAVGAPDATVGTPDAAVGTPDAGGGLAVQIQAATATATTNAACTAITPFYWEIGDQGSVIASGQAGVAFSATTKMEIASATKFYFGAYVVERLAANLGSADYKAMTMRSGYASFSYDACLTTTTVDDCFHAGQNATYTAAKDGIFNYGGGHFQKYAEDLGLGADDSTALAAEFAGVLGNELNISFRYPQLAAGMQMSAANYRLFLQKVLAGGLELHDHLGENPVATACPDPTTGNCYSPAPEAWHYSWGHWIEDDSSKPFNDGAFSSPGFYGFYPWIDAGKRYYGIVARYQISQTAYVESVQCGRRIRKAFLDGVAVTD